METNRLRHFCTLAKTESLTKAADLLGITHSGLHKSLKTLEDELGFKLTKPKGRGISLTDEAVDFYPKALEIVELIEKSLNQNKTVGKQKKIRLAGIEVFLPFLANELPKEPFFKDYNFELHDFAPGELEDAVKNKKVDFGVTYIPVPTKGLSFLQITSFEMSVLCNNKGFQKKKFEEIPFVTPHSPLVRNPADIKNRDGWAETKLKRLVKFQTNSLFAAFELVKSGQCAIYAPDFLLAYLPRTSFSLRFKKEQQRKLYLVLRDEKEEDLETKKICKILRNWIKNSKSKS